MIKREEIKPIKTKNVYHSVYLLRISKDRIADLENLFDFANYMKCKKFNRLIIHVYGTGNYIEEFKNKIIERKLEKYVKYEGVLVDISKELQIYDFVTDFTLNHSFGMTYLEAILNGKMVFGMINQGSKQALKELPYCYINSFDDLIYKVKNIDKISLDDLQRNYDIIYNKYSRDAITDKFIKYLE